MFNSESQADQLKYRAWTFPIAVSRTANHEMKQAAVSLANALGQDRPILVDKNPVCCFWLEVDEWAPNPNEPGYIINIQAGGAIIRATSEAQLQKAVEKVKSISLTEGGKVKLPTGVLITSYPVLK